MLWPALAAAIAVVSAAPVRSFATTEEDLDRAESLALEGRRAFGGGRFEEAALLFLRAFELSARPAQLHNAARAMERAEKIDRAVALWERYAALETIDEDKRRSARERAAALLASRVPAIAPLDDDDRVIIPRPPAPAALAPESPVSGPREEAVELSGIAKVAIGAGAAVAVIGGALYLSGWTSYWSHRERLIAGLDPELTYRDAEAARVRSGAGIVALGAGVVTVVAALMFGSVQSAGR